MKLAILTDSTCDLTAEYLEQNNVHVLPLKVIYKEREYLDRIEIQPEDIYRRFAEEIPKTSMPSPGEVRELFNQLCSQGYTHVIAMHVSGGLSGTIDVVRMVAQEFPQLITEVIDSKALSLGLGFLVMKAVQLRELGAKFTDLVNQIKEAQKKTKVFFVVKTLEYLIKGGRIGLIRASLGEILNVKPIISINENGKYFTYAQARGRKKSIAKLKEIFLDHVQGKQVDLAVAHGDAEEECLGLLKDLLKAAEANIRQHYISQLGPVMVVHAGPGLLGVAFQEVN